MGEEDRNVIVATHFPCSCVPDGESIFISCKQEKVEVQEQYDKTVHPKEAYVVFYIDTVEGGKTPKRGRFRSKAVTQFKYLCVYGEKGITVGEALKRDGRFSDDLSNYMLSDNEDPKVFTVLTQTVDNLHQKKFKLCRPPKKGSGKKTGSVLDVVNERGRSVKNAIEQPDGNISSEEIYELLRQQFLELKEWMESRFPGDSYQKKLDVRKENFGKIQQSFSEVHRLKKLLQMAKSVCKIQVQNVCLGTGFVLFENFILTNAHLFKGCVEGKNLKDHINVFVLFNYDDPEPDTNYFYFTVEKALIDLDDNLDYAILKLNPDGQRSNPRTRPKNVKVPPGLLNKLGPLPENGEACIIGHPAGDVKKIDPTCIIEPDKRNQIVTQQLLHYNEMFIVQSVQELKKQGIENIMMGGDRAEQVSTYNTFMYHGSSGSPVFDAHGQVFGLHTAGYVDTLSNNFVIECARSLLVIFQKFVCNMKESGNELLLEKVQTAAAGNEYLNKILKVEPMEVD
uniref:Serine protease n=2 Tax=Kryptolebias marmoratus TaxID=37003 RepID=A0A3Q3G9A6_KRYMA